ncbi:MAG: hypothetical protein AAGF77_09015 [Bacteroidota bacterium]
MIVASCYKGTAQFGNYKYVIVPAKFESFKAENQHQTSTLVKYLLTNEGFNAVYSNDVVPDLMDNPCLALRTRLIDNSNLFTTKVMLSFVDCNGLTVFESQQGSTKTKEFKQAYREAISEAFGSLRGLATPYKDSSEPSKQITTKDQNNTASIEIDKNVKDGLKKDAKVTPKGMHGDDGHLLYAQPIEDGYQLVDKTPKVIYILKSTAAPDVFMVTKDGKNGVIYKNSGEWFLEMDQKGSKAEKLNIKF